MFWAFVPYYIAVCGSVTFRYGTGSALIYYGSGVLLLSSVAENKRIVKKFVLIELNLNLKQCCGSGMFIPDPGSWFLPIPDPGSKNSNKREGWKNIWCHTFLCSHKFHKIVHYFSFEVPKKKIWANFQRIIELFAQKIVTKLSKVWVWDPGSGKNLFRIPDPQHCLKV